ncbi:MAG: type II toxin-antitoxin system PemK/MazF family toxin [Anaerolineae bacterium]|nr:type II toxin-antitoxin system PemK/MazF family toxin [Anaerolineae bacterium]
MLAFISSVVPQLPGQSEIILTPTQGDFPATGLKVPSVIRLDKLATIDRLLIVRKLGVLTMNRLNQVDNALLHSLEITIERYLQAERERWIQVVKERGNDSLLVELMAIIHSSNS